MLRLMDFRSAGEGDGMSTNLKLLAAIDLGVLAVPFVGKRKGTFIMWKQQPKLFKW